MKRFLIFFAVLSLLLLVSIPVAAQANTNETPALGIDLTTFAGVVAVVSLIVTQLTKVLPVIQTTTILKICIPVVLGIVISLVSWHFGWAVFLTGMVLWQVILQGVIAGLASCGFYDLIKTIFKPGGYPASFSS